MSRISETLRTHRRYAVALVLVLSAVVCLAAVLPSCQSAKPLRPPLVVCLVIDQMRSDYLDRFAPHFSGGLARVLATGTVFPNTYHNHSATETAVGHATLATGCYPRHHGVVSNDWYDRSAGRWVYAVEDSTVRIVGYPDAPGRSPRSLMRPALGDALKAAMPTSRVISIALKDRPAILMGGQQPDLAVWYHSEAGRWVTSSYYADSLPGWLDSLNNSGLVESYREAGWELSQPESTYAAAREDAFAAESDGVHTTFPHPFPGGDDSLAAYYDQLLGTPFGDELTLAVARAAVDHYRLGRSGGTDLLMVSCSAADYVGHEYGPMSREIMDYYLRLDGWLGAFLDHLDSTVGLDNYLLAFTSDHGVMPLPEQLQSEGVAARRASAREIDSTMRSVGAALSAELGLTDNVIRRAGEEVFLGYAEAEASGMTRASLDSAVAALLRALPFVEDVFTSSDLADAATGVVRPYQSLYRNNFEQERFADLIVRFPEHALVTEHATGTTHGSPYRYDTKVPLVFCGFGVEAGVVADSVQTVDVAATLLDILNIPGESALDGRTLAPLLAGDEPAGR